MNLKNTILALLLTLPLAAQPSLCDPKTAENGFYLAPTGDALDPNCTPTGFSFMKTALLSFGWSLDKTKTIDLSNWLNATPESAKKAAKVIAQVAPDSAPVVIEWNYPNCFVGSLWPTSSVCFTKPITLVVLWPTRSNPTGQWTTKGYPLLAGLVCNLLMRNSDAEARRVLADELDRARNALQ